MINRKLGSVLAIALPKIAPMGAVFWNACKTLIVGKIVFCDDMEYTFLNQLQNLESLVKG